MKYQYVAWDYNGTILDDVYAALASVNDILERRNREAITIEQYYSYVESPIIGFYRHLFDLNEIPFEVLAEEYQSGYALHKDKCRIMPYAREIIEKLNAQNITQFILSASKRQLVLDGLKEYDLLKFFGEENVLGRTDHYAIGKIDLAEKYIKENNIFPEKLLIIGDTLGDIDVAIALNCDCILHTKGHQSKEDLEKSGMPVINDLSELLSIL